MRCAQLFSVVCKVMSLIWYSACNFQAPADKEFSADKVCCPTAGKSDQCSCDVWFYRPGSAGLLLIYCCTILLCGKTTRARLLVTAITLCSLITTGGCFWAMTDGGLVYLLRSWRPSFARMKDIVSHTDTETRECYVDSSLAVLYQLLWLYSSYHLPYL